MQRQAKVQQSQLTGMLLGVVPIALQSQRDYATKIYLHFAKGPALISRHQTPHERIKKDWPVSFALPEQVKSFRVPNGTIPECHWNLYIRRVDIIGQNEEFLAGQKIDLNPLWMDFKDSHQNCFQQTVTFPKMKIKLTFLVIIGSSPQELIDASQRMPGDSKWESITADGKIREIDTPLSSQLETGSSRQKQESYNMISRLSLTQVGEEEEINLHQITKVNYEDQHRSHQSIRASQYRKSQLSQPEEYHKLSNSDIEIGNQIQEKIHFSEVGYVLKPLINTLIKQEDSKHETSTKTEASIRNTSSQILDEKGNPISVPYYKKRSFYYFISVILLLLIGLIAIRDQGYKENRRQVKGKKGQRQKTEKSRQKVEKTKKAEAKRKVRAK